MSAQARKGATSGAATAAETMAALRRQYGCGPVELTGSADALYERHLFFDNVSDPAVAGARERYEAFARSVRDVLSQRWVRTEQTYERQNPKRIYYLSMEFLIGRSLANNVANLMLDPVVRRRSSRERLSTGSTCSRRNRTPGWATADSGVWPRASSTRWPRCRCPPSGYGLRYEYGMFRQSIDNGWQIEQPDHWLRRPDPWESRSPATRSVEVKLNCSIEIRERSADVPSPAGRLRCSAFRTIARSSAMAARRSTPCGCGRQPPPTSSTSGNSAPATSSARWRRRSPPSHSRGCSIRMTPRRAVSTCASSRSIFSSRARWPISCAASAARNPTGTRSPTRSPSSSTTRTRRWPSPS